MRRVSVVFAAYTLLAAAATWPLLRDARTLIASDPGDPLLNASILLWNATTVPFSAGWWNAPHYYPSVDVAAFTETLAGISPIATPVYWLTRNPLLAYNLSAFLTWPISAFAAYLLVRVLARREDAAFLSGLAFGFSPYRVVALGHIQTLATFGVPLLLLALHGYLENRRVAWLALAGLAWLQQSLANGYYVLYGGVLVGLWLLYFCARRDGWRAGVAIAAALAMFSVPLAPILLKYRAVHEAYDFHRTLNEIMFYSALTRSWFETDAAVWLWHFVFPPGKDNMFPGIAAVAVASAGIVWLLARREPADAHAAAPGRGYLHLALGAGTALSVVAIFASMRYGNIDTTIAGVPVKMRNMDRALVMLLAFGGPLVALTPRTRDALARRSALVFYAAATIVVALLSFGPAVRAGDDVIWKPAPYAWLMAMLPGFDELRTPTQIKMIVIACLAVAAGLAYAAIVQHLSRRRAFAVCVAVSAGILLDGWMLGARMEPAAALWPVVEPADHGEPILELPLGPANDFAATFRAAWHHRRVLNGVSGYEPRHYDALKRGLAAHDPSLLAAIGSLGAYDIVVDGDADPDGANARYASAAAGAVRAAGDGRRTAYRVAQGAPEPVLGAALTILSVRAVRGEAEAGLMHDGRMDTGWGDYPQEPDEWVVADLGDAHEIGGVSTAIGEYYLDYPRRLTIELSLDSRTWEVAWEGSTFAQTFLGYVRDPRNATLRFPFTARPARYVRLRQVERSSTMWRVSELRVHAPAS